MRGEALPGSHRAVAAGRAVWATGVALVSTARRRAPHVGSLAVHAISTRDYPLLTASVIVGSTMVAVGLRRWGHPGRYPAPRAT